MKVSALDHRNAKEVAELMHRIKPDWWPSAADAYGQLTDLSETIGTIGWVLEDDSGRPRGGRIDFGRLQFGRDYEIT